MVTTRHQTIRLPQGEEGAALLREILGQKVSWADAHGLYPGADIEIVETPDSLFDEAEEEDEE